MYKPVTAIITSTQRGIDNLRLLLLSIDKQVLKPQQAIVIYDSFLNPGLNLPKDYSFALEYIGNPDKLSLTYLQNQVMLSKIKTNILLLNDDVILEQDFLSQLTLVLQVNLNVGIACGKILRMDKQTIDTTGQFLSKNRSPLERGYNALDKGQFNLPGVVFGACGAAVLYRREMLEDIVLDQGQYVDNDYHLFYEDLDLSWRAYNLGWEAFYTPKAVAYHLRGASAKIRKPRWKFLQAYNFAWLSNDLKKNVVRNRYLTIIKNDRVCSFLLNLPYILFYELKLWLYCLFFAPKVILSIFFSLPFFIRALKKRELILKKIEDKE
ncbi:MAG: hypothetical protein DRP78_07315 [Candidatus Omnitrophota bacterium]|nr:MAG: hypothetical protein DRP78_07315 [Candidatus Omnitrophota bacterium]